jgi:heat shock protein HslJ
VLERDRFTWRLHGESDVTQITLEVGHGRLTGKTGCGDYTADFTRTGDAWTVTRVQRKNMLPCPNTTSAMSERFLGLLPEVTRVQANGNQLQLMAPGETLFFSRK